MSEVQGLLFSVKIDMPIGALPLVPMLRLDHALFAIYNDLTCTTADGKPNQKNVPQELTYLGGKDNFGVWKMKSTDSFRERFKQSAREARQVIPIPPPSNNLEELGGNLRSYAEAAAAKAGCSPNHAAFLAELEKVDLSSHPIFFESLRDNYVDVFRLGPIAFKPWLQEFMLNDKPPGVVYLMDYEALKPIKEYLNNQPLESEVHTINWLYSAAASAYYLEQIADTLTDGEPQDVTEEIQDAVDEATGTTSTMEQKSSTASDSSDDIEARGAEDTPTSTGESNEGEAASGTPAP